MRKLIIGLALLIALASLAYAQVSGWKRDENGNYIFYRWSDNPEAVRGWEPAVNATPQGWWPLAAATPVPTTTWPPDVTPGHRVYEQEIRKTPNPGDNISMRGFDGLQFSPFSNSVILHFPKTATMTPTMEVTATSTPTLTMTETPTFTFTMTPTLTFTTVPTSTPTIAPPRPPRLL